MRIYGGLCATLFFGSELSLQWVLVSFYTLIFVLAKQTRFNMLLSEL